LRADGRSALLDSIRNPGLRLRKVTDEINKSEPPKKKPAPSNDGGDDGEGVNSTSDAPADAAPKKKASAPPPMDMMSALAAKLKMRAKAMSGKQDDDEYVTILRIEFLSLHVTCMYALSSFFPCYLQVQGSACTQTRCLRSCFRPETSFGPLGSSGTSDAHGQVEHGQRGRVPRTQELEEGGRSG
jgi:hypothetical protein